MNIMHSNWTLKFKRTQQAAFGLSPEEANPIQVFHQPLYRRFFYALCRHGWTIVPVVLAVLALSGCSDIDAEIATAASVADAIADAGKVSK